MTNIIYGAEAIDWIENNIKNLRKMLSEALKEQERIEQSNIDYLTRRFPVGSMAQVKNEYFDYWRTKVGKPILTQYALVEVVGLDSRGISVCENGACERMDIGMAANVLRSLNEQPLEREIVDGFGNEAKERIELTDAELEVLTAIQCAPDKRVHPLRLVLLLKQTVDVPADEIRFLKYHKYIETTPDGNAYQLGSKGVAAISTDVR